MIIKDLENALLFVGSINGMQVKEYAKELQSETKRRIEKIGSCKRCSDIPSEFDFVEWRMR
jgi:hypothetical protein